MVNEPYKNTGSINLWTSKWKSLKRCSFHIKINLCRGDIRSGLRWPVKTHYEWFIFSTRWKSQFLSLMCRPQTGVEFTATQGGPPLHCITFCLLIHLHCLDYLSDWVKIPQWSFSKNHLHLLFGWFFHSRRNHFLCFQNIRDIPSSAKG